MTEHVCVALEKQSGSAAHGTTGQRSAALTRAARFTWFFVVLANYQLLQLQCTGVAVLAFLRISEPQI